MDIKGYNKNYSYFGCTNGEYAEYVSDKEYWEMIGYTSYPKAESNKAKLSLDKTGKQSLKTERR